MRHIGLVGENPNDSHSLKNLLGKRYSDTLFNPILERVSGSNIYRPKFQRLLQKELSNHKYSYIIFMTDLDDLETNTKKIKVRESWFKELNIITKGKGILLLNIYELEALILSDIGNFNKLFGTKLKFTGDPMKIVDPKKHLKRETAKHRRKYIESDCPEIFKQLDIKTVAKNCTYFKEFLAVLNSKLKQAA